MDFEPLGPKFDLLKKQVFNLLVEKLHFFVFENYF